MQIMSKARIIWTFDCKRKCPNCCNNYKNILNNATELNSLSELKDYEQIMITGGEPMLYPDKLISFIKTIKNINPTAKLFLYTAWYNEKIVEIIKLLDGIQYSLHSQSTIKDIEDFYVFQRNISHHNSEKSFRLFIDSDITSTITIIPNLWKRIEIKPWIKEGECPLPQGEILLINKTGG